ncbi:MAG: 30S ribosomal protein S19 [bacterium]|nr:30S ribosomal protein S19 [bacterium]
MSRSLRKGPYLDENLMKKLKTIKPGGKEVIKTWARASTITPEMVGYIIGVHNGKVHIPVSIGEEMVGHKLGEFSLTRKFVRHGGKMQRELEATQKAADTAKAQATKSVETPAGKK